MLTASFETLIPSPSTDLLKRHNKHVRPICYDINIEIVRTDEDGDTETIDLPRTIRSDTPLSHFKLGEKAIAAFADFMTMVIQYDPSRQNDYELGQRYRTEAVYQC